jgi:hypothetical protein
LYNATYSSLCFSTAAILTLSAAKVALLFLRASSVSAIDLTNAAYAELNAFKLRASSAFKATSPLSNLDYKDSINPITFYKEA